MKKLKSSFVAKTFLVCFVSVHVPLIVLAGYLALGFQPGVLSILLLILGATLVGTALCLFAIWRLIRPLNLLADAMKRYPEDKGILKLHPKSPDEIGTVTDIARATLLQVENLTKQLKHQAMTDFLTGLGNRRALMEQMPIIRAKAARPEEAVSLILFDLDHFKRINDEYGHDAGDNVLMAIGEAVKDHLRPYDYAARMGGEEFCIVLPGADLAAAETVAERLRRAVESRVVEPLPKGRITYSFGVAQARPTERMQELLHCNCNDALVSVCHQIQNASSNAS